MNSTCISCCARVPGHPARNEKYKSTNDELTNLIDKGIVEWHTHWNGILDPFHYVSSCLPFAAVDAIRDGRKSFNVRAGYMYARRAITEYSRNDEHDQNKKKPSKNIIKKLEDYVDSEGKNDEADDFTKLILSANTKESSKFKTIVHWERDAYKCRDLILYYVRDKFNGEEAFGTIPLHKFPTDDDGLVNNIEEWLEEDKSKLEWKVDILESIKEKNKKTTSILNPIESLEDAFKKNLELCACEFRKMISNYVKSKTKSLYISPANEQFNSVENWIEKEKGNWKRYIEEENKNKITTPISDFTEFVEFVEFVENALNSNNSSRKLILNVTKFIKKQITKTRYENIRFVVRAARLLCGKYIRHKESEWAELTNYGKPRERRPLVIDESLDIKLSLSTIKYNYAEAIIKELRKHENNVIFADISASNNFHIDTKELKVSWEILDCLCQQFPIHTATELPGQYAGKDMRFKFRTLVPINGNSLKGKCYGEVKTGIEEEINEALEINYHFDAKRTIGIDILGLEPDYDETLIPIIKGIYMHLLECEKEYRKWKKKDFMPLIFRIHVGESDMSDSRYDENKAEKGRKNIQIVLCAIQQLFEAYDRNVVSIRLGHVSAVTIGQAYYMRNVGIPFEINSISNLRTHAVRDMGHLPILKFFIADAIHLYNKTKNIVKAIEQYNKSPIKDINNLMITANEEFTSAIEQYNTNKDINSFIKTIKYNNKKEINIEDIKSRISAYNDEQRINNLILLYSTVNGDNDTCTNVEYIKDLISAYNYTESIKDNTGRIGNLILLHNNTIFGKSKIYKYFFTCNSDANGVMKSNIREEYELNLQLLESFIEDKELQDGTRPTVSVISDGQINKYNINANDKMLDSKVLQGLVVNVCEEQIKYNDFKEDVKLCFRSPINYIKEGQPERGFFWS